MTRAPVAAADPMAAQRARYSHREVQEVLGALLLALLTAMVSSTVIATALPTIVGALGGQDQLSWVATAQLLTLTVSTPLWGKLSDLFGRKLMFQTALAVFVAGSLMAGFAPNIGELIAGRAIQGLGAGGLYSLTQVILGDIVEPRERGRYTGYTGAVFGVATVAGPLLGGFIVDTDWLGWRWCFFVCVPLAVVAFAVLQKVLRLPRVERKARIDWYGAGTITAGATTLMLLLSLGGQEFAWSSPWTYVLGALSASLLVLAVIAERHAAEPILPPRLFRNRTFVFTSIASLFVGMAMFGVMIYMPQYLQIVKGLTPTASGLMTLPMVCGMLIASIGAGKAVTVTGRWKIFPAVGLLMIAGGMVLLSRLHAGSPRPIIGADLAVIGFGLGLSMQILILAAQNAVRDPDMASATSGVAFFRALGGATGVAAYGAILTIRLRDELTAMLQSAHITMPGGSGDLNLGSPKAIYQLPGPVLHIIQESFTRAMQTVFLVGAPIALLGFLAVLALKELPLRGERSRKRSRRVSGVAGEPATKRARRASDPSAKVQRGTEA
ncbi:MAG TPA: MDR family MFS transporter [Streptosporangiaceae bacterium]|jgi:EmrB/QacA subfamily drug resistance transporter